MWIDLSKWAKDVKICVSHVKAHEKVTSAEEEFDNQVDRITHSVDSQPLSQSFLSFLNEPMNKGTMVAEMGLCMGLTTWTSIHQADLAIAAAECQICQQQRPTLNPRYGTIPQGDQPATWWQIDYIGPLPL